MSARVLASCIINVTGKVATPQVATGNGFTVVLKADGTVWTIGNNEKGQLGNGKTGNTTDTSNENDVGARCIVPEQVKISETEKLTNIIKIAVGTDHVLALTKNGEIYAWGDNTYGQLATEIKQNETTENTTNTSDGTDVGAGPVSAHTGYATKVLNEDGTGKLNNIVDIDTGEKISIALDKDGNVYEWGNGKDLPTRHTIDNIVRVSVGKDNMAALESNGLLWTWGENEKGQTGSNSTTSYTWPLAVTVEVTEVTCGGRHTVIQKTDEKIYATGNLYGTKTFEEIELPVVGAGPVSAQQVKYIKAGYDTTTIMLKDGTIYGEGGNAKGQLGIGTNTEATKFTQGLINVETTENDNPDTVGAISNRPLENVIIIGDSIGDGKETTLNTTAIVENGDVYISGDNTHSQMDNNTTTPSNYYTKMGFIYLDYADKVIEIEQDAGYQIDLNKLKYKNSSVNVYSNDKEKKLGEIKYTSFNTDIITVDQTGYIKGLGKQGVVKVRIEDITNGYETYITVIAGKLIDTDTVIYIYNIEDLIKFRDTVNEGNDYAGKTVYLMADIDMSSACSETKGSWTPIGNYASDTSLKFAGTFEGNYHKLSNIYINTDQSYQGLFGYSNGYIYNLKINGNIVSTDNYTGGIVGQNTGIIINCHNEARIQGNTSIGGIAGISSIGYIDRCSNKAEIYAVDGDVGGIVGTQSDGGCIFACYNTGYIHNSRLTSGGIVGYIKEGNIFNCYNTGEVYSPTNSGGIAGVAGYFDNTARTAHIYNSYNIGSITGSASVNSIIGAIAFGGSASSTNCYTTDATVGNLNAGDYSYNSWETDDFNINDGYPILWWQAPTIELNKKQAYIGITEQLQLRLIQNEDISNFLGKDLEMTDFIWTSSNEDVATVDENGLVMGTSDGYTTIYGKYKENEKINVMCVINVAGEKATPQIETGNGFTAILKADGTVWTIGNNEKGVLGNGTTGNDDSDYKSATQVKISETEYLTNVIKISAGPNHVLALTKNGEVYAWGDNTHGQLGTGALTSNSLTSDISPLTSYATRVSGEGGSSTLKRIIDISAGTNGSTAINEFGWVFVWGNGTNGEMGNGSTISSNTPVKTPENTGISVSMGEGHVVTLGQSGKTYTWGLNTSGQLGINNTTNNSTVSKIADGITEISARGNETIVKNVNGEVYGTGLNTSGQLGIGTNSNVTTLTKMTLPTNNLTSDVSPLTSVKYIKAGSTNTTLMLSDGTVWSTGLNTNGELGNGTNDNKNTFVQGLTLVETTEQPLTSVLTIGRNTGLNTAVITENGDIYTTGDNTYSQIGDGTKTSTNYYKKMGFVALDYKDKIVPVNETGYQIDLNKLKYIFASINVYKDNEEAKEYTLGEIKFTSLDESIATVSNEGLILGQVPTGEVRIKIEDITNGYETYITAKVNINRLEDTDTVIYIYNIEDLVKFRDTVNAGNDYAGKTVYLMADIDMSPACSATVGSWEPIGTDTTIFAGTFEGNYHTLSNLYYNSNAYTYVGLFANNNGTIQDLIMENVDIYAYKTGTNDYIHASGIVGTSNGKIINCGINSGEVTAYNNTAITGSGWRNSYSGGIVGSRMTNNLKIMNCYNKANVTAIAYNTSSARTSGIAGGIIGYADRNPIENCYNTGNINAVGKNGYSGGIVGDVARAQNVINSYSIGVITGTAAETLRVGGIIGLNRANNALINSYCGTGSAYSQVYDNGSARTEGIVNPTTDLKTYAGTLGSAYENDDFNINDGYPILWWQAPTIELNKKQAYIKSGENLQLEIIQNENLPNALVGKTNITDFTWASTNKDVATVDQNALVTGISEGYTTIYGTHKEYNNVYVMCIINVAKNIATPQIETGDGFTAILKADGTVWMTGNPDIIATGTGANDTTVSTDGNATTVGARGTVPGLRRTCSNKNKCKYIPK